MANHLYVYGFFELTRFVHRISHLDDGSSVLRRSNATV